MPRGAPLYGKVDEAPRQQPFPGDAIAELSEDAIAYLKAGGRERDVPAGDVIVRQGEPGRSFYVVLAGEAEAYLDEPGGARLPLARFGPGSSFGEMALLRGEPVSATVGAVSAATLLEYPGEELHAALAECEPLRLSLLTTLADRLERTSREAWSLHRRAQAFRSLLDSGARPEELVAESAHMRKVVKRVQELAGGRGPVLVTGEPGAGKLLVSRTLHAASGGGALVVVDCARLPEADAGRVVLGSADDGDGPGSDGTLGAVHLPGMATVVLAHVEALPRPVQRRLAALAAGGGGAALPRIVATSSCDLSELAAAGRFDPALVRLLDADTVAVPRLCDRKLDVLPLVRLFLAARGGEGSHTLAQDAEHAFVSRRYRNRNVAELREAVELAADFAAGGTIRAEHIFAGPKSEAGPAEADLTGVPLVSWIARPATLGLLRGAVLAAFAAVIALAVAMPQRAAGQIANAAIWGVWEPVIIIAFLLLGHVWCTVCPLSTAARWAQRLVALAKPPPAWLKRWSVWLATAGFFAIIWFERAFHMTENPVPSGVLLLALIGLAVSFAVVYQRETWCRYVCPLGALAAGYALPATLQVRANPSVCATYCTDHACYKGAAGAGGCPVFHHPLFASEGNLCKLCFTCLDVCPHGSAKLYLRPPLQAVWRLGGLSAALVPFSLSVLFLAPVILAAQRAAWPSGVAALSVAMLAALAAGAGAARLLPRLLGDDGDRAIASRVAFALLVLAWGPLMAYQLGNVGALAALVIRAAPGTPIEGALPAAGITLQLALQLGVVALAAALTCVTLWRTRVWLLRHRTPAAAGRWRVLHAASLAYAAAAAVLLVAF